jgi:hypothetical protein
MSGAVLVLSVFAALVWGLGAGVGRSGGGHARRARDAAANASTAAGVRPWIVPIPACASSVASGVSAPVEPTVAARRPSRTPRPAVGASAAPLPDEGTSDAPCAVSVNSVPWSEVWIDGKNTGKHTPFVDVPIDCGAHRIDFKRPDLQIAATESIVVKAGETFKRRYTLAGGE